MAQKMTVKQLKAMAQDPALLRSLTWDDLLPLERAIKEKYGNDRGRDLFIPIHDARRFVNLVDQFHAVGNGAQPALPHMDLNVQDYPGSAFLYRVHLACDSTLINGTAGAAALLGASVVERHNRYWLRLNNGWDDLARRLSDQVGVKFYAHVL